MDLRQMKDKIHQLELVDKYDKVYDVLVNESIDEIDMNKRTFYIKEIVWLLEEAYSPFCRSTQLVTQIDSLYELLYRCSYCALLYPKDDKNLNWYLCYYLDDYIRFHYFFKMFDFNEDEIIKVKSNLLSFCKRMYKSSVLFDLIPKIGHYSLNGVSDCQDDYIRAVYMEIQDLGLGDNYPDVDFLEDFKPFITRYEVLYGHSEKYCT